MLDCSANSNEMVVPRPPSNTDEAMENSGLKDLPHNCTQNIHGGIFQRNCGLISTQFVLLAYKQASPL